MNPPSDQVNQDDASYGDIENNRRRSNRILGRPPSYEEGYNDNIPTRQQQASRQPNEPTVGIISPHGVPAQPQYPASAPPQYQYRRDFMQEMLEREQQQGIVPPSAPHPFPQRHPASGAGLPPPVNEVQLPPGIPDRRPRQIFPQNIPPPAGGLLIDLQQHQRDDSSHHSTQSSHHSSHHSSNHSSANQLQYEYPAHMQQQHEVTNLRTNFNQLSDTVTALQRDLGTVTASNQRTEEHLARIDETHASIAEAIAANTEAMRKFTRDDIGPIVEAHMTTVFKAKKKRKKKRRKKRRRRKTRSNGGSGDDSSDDSSSSSSDDSSSDDSSSDDSSDNNNNDDGSSVYVEPRRAQRQPEYRQPQADPGNAPAPQQQHQPAVSTPDLAAMLQGVIKAVAPKEKLLLPPLKKSTKTAYQVWKKEAMITIRIHSLFSPFVTTSLTGTTIIQPNITTQLKGMLYMSLSKSLDSTVKADIGWDNIDVSDGVAILQKMEEEFGLKQESTLNTLDLVTALNKTKKQKDEKLSAYHRRFKQALEECKVNNVLGLTDGAIRILYLRNLQEPCLTTRIVNMEQGVPTQWTAILNLDELQSKVKSYLKAYSALNPVSSHTRNKQTKSDHQDTGRGQHRTTTATDDEEYKKRIRRVVGGLKLESEEKIINHISNMVKLRPGGCFIHNHDKHRLLECKKLKDLCGQYQCLPCLAKVVDSAPALSAKRARAQIKKERDAISEEREAMAKQQEKLERQMKKNSDMMKVLKVTMQSQALVTSGQRALSTNPFDGLDLDTDEEEQEETVDDDNADDQMDEAVDDLTSNNTTESYSSLQSSSSPANQLPHTILATCKKLSSSTSNAYTVVDSGATVHMDNDENLFEYITTVTDANGLPLYVQQGDGSDLEVQGMGPVTKTIQGKYPIRYMSYLVKELGTPLFSVKQHMENAGCYFHAENNTATLAFPAVTITLDTEPEILFQSVPSNPIHDIFAFDYQCATPATEHGTFKASIVEKSKYIEHLPTKYQEQLGETVPFKLMSPDATLPTRATSGSIGYDIASTATVTILPGAIARIPTGLSCAIPEGLYIKIHNRSSNALKHLTVEGGVIDNDYRGEIQVLLKNNSTQAITVPSKNRIAQMIFERAATPMLNVTTHLPSTSRKGGFGSTNRQRKQKKRRGLNRRKRGIIHTSQGSMYIDEQNPKKPKSKRVSRRPSEGVRTPKESSDQYLWTSHKFSSDKDAEEAEIFFQQHDHNKVPTSAPATAPATRPQPNAVVEGSAQSSLTMTRDHLLQSIGYIKPDKFIRNINKLGKGNVQISHLARNPKVNPGEAASVKSKRSNKIPQTPKANYSDLWHMDIGYGPCAAIGGFKHTLLFVNSSSQYKYIYPLKNLTSSLLRGVKCFSKM